MRPRLDLVMFSLVLALVATGVVAVYSSSYPRVLGSASFELDDPSAVTMQQIDDTVDAQQGTVRKQVQWVALGFLVMLLAMVAPYRWLKNPWLVWVVTVAAIALLIAVLLFGTDNDRSSKRWLWFMQPSEFGKVALCWYLAYALAELKEHVTRLGRVMVWLLPVGLMLCLVKEEPHLGCTMVMAAVTLTMLYLAGVPKSFLGGLVAFGTLFVWHSLQAHPYQMDRFRAWLDPLAYADTIGYQTIHCGTALSRGAVWGRGLGRSLEKFFYLPECSGDSVLAIFGEEFGLVGVGLVLLLFVLLALRGVALARRCGADRFGRYLVMGLTATIFCQAVLNYGVTSGLLPQTGVGLPFISYGGSALLCFMGSVGLLLNLSRVYPEDARGAAQRRRMERPGVAVWDATQVE